MKRIENNKAQSIIIRSKEKFILNEEKPTKYFFLLEKQNKKHIKYLQNERGKLLQKNLEILQECKHFFQTLYTKQNTCETTQN